MHMLHETRIKKDGDNPVFFLSLKANYLAAGALASAFTSAFFSAFLSAFFGSGLF